CGQGLIGFGNIIIIKHDDDYLSAYANTSSLQVNEGQNIKKGQIIAKVGDVGIKRTSLHFQIRKNGKPVNPLQLLPKK
ncbi:MAG: peptidoglycan DD-metalloendopeptidase family protein, partial [Methylococcales bacterium]|nr:peptidoglycan DD-metalloendopeptidase family protein [Methylococcales bacterium]